MWITTENDRHTEETTRREERLEVVATDCVMMQTGENDDAPCKVSPLKTRESSPYAGRMVINGSETG